MPRFANYRVLGIRTPKPLIYTALLGVSLLNANAAEGPTVYRCINADGQTEFRQYPCQGPDEGARVLLEDHPTGWTPPPAESGRELPAADATEARQTEPDHNQYAGICWKKRQQLDEINWKLRRGYSAAQGDKLRHQRRKHEEYIRAFCR